MLVRKVIYFITSPMLFREKIKKTKIGYKSRSKQPIYLSIVCNIIHCLLTDTTKLGNFKSGKMRQLKK